MSFQSLSILSVNCQTRDPTRTGVHPAHEAHGARGSIITGCLQPGASSEHQPPTPVLELCAAELMALWSEPDSSGEKALSEDQEAVIQGRGRQGAGSGVLRSWGESSRFLQSWRRPVSPAVTCGEPQPPPEGAAFLLLLLHTFTSYFCIPVPYNEKDIFFGCRSQSMHQGKHGMFLG